MLNLAAFAALLLFSGFAIAQISAPDCSSTTWNWTYNSHNQSPCAVAAYLQSTCNGGTFTVDPLPAGYQYAGPYVLDGGDLCKCSTVTYSLLSACGACQEELWISWSEWITNCTTVLPPSTFPNAVPAGTSVPQWALANVTSEALALWDSIAAMGIGDSPEIGPGALIGNSNTTSATTGSRPTGTTSPSPTLFPTVTPSPSSPSSSSPPTSSSSKGSSSNTGAIVGGTVGGAVVIAIAAVGVFFLRRRPPNRCSASFVIDVPSQPNHEFRKPLSDDGSHPRFSTVGEPIVPMRRYDPNDATTFPGYRESLRDPYGSAQPPSQYHGTGNARVNMHVSRPHEYNSVATT